MSDLGRPTPAPPPLPGAPADPSLFPMPSGAGFGIRFLARLIDLIYGSLIGFGVGLMTAILFAILSRLGRLTPDWPVLVREHKFRGFGIGLLGAFLYHWISEGVGSTTVGKLICGLRVAQRDGAPATMKGAFIRDLAYHLDVLFFGLIGYVSMKASPLQQRYGDVWGRTVVVKTDVFEPRPGRSPLRMTLGLLAGSVLWGSMTLLQLVIKVM